MRRRALAIAVALLAMGCPSLNTPSEVSTANCVNFTGQYTGAFQSCGASTTGDVTLFQIDSCIIRGVLPGVGTLQGTVQGATIVFTISFSPCGGSASGSALPTTSGGLTGTYSGQATGAGCCNPVTGSFALTRK